MAQKTKHPSNTLKQILMWADEHYDRTGEWTHRKSRRVKMAPEESWHAINAALGDGRRGLTGGDTLFKLLVRSRNAIPPKCSIKPEISIKNILDWADEHRTRTGQWPHRASGLVQGVENLSWDLIGDKLARGGCGLPGGNTLPKLLANHRGVPNQMGSPLLSIRKILQWADEFHSRTGEWPGLQSGPVMGAPQTTWLRINDALYAGRRGLSGGSSLLQVLAKYRGVRHWLFPPPLTIEQILRWADTHHKHSGNWPTMLSGVIRGAEGETWSCINSALIKQKRGLKGRTTLIGLLVRRRGMRSAKYAPKLTLKKILGWADFLYEQTGSWPTRYCRIDPPEPDETWFKIYAALSAGTRGLGEKTTLRKLLLKHRMPEYEQSRTPLLPDHILEWAADHHELYGKLPTKNSGPVRGMDGEHWFAIDASLRAGTRTRPGGSSLQEFLRGHYEKSWPGIGRKLTEEKILKWADSFRERVGKWPTSKSAYTDPSRTERWEIVDLCLREGHRGLPGGSSFRKLLAEYRFGRERH